MIHPAIAALCLVQFPPNMDYQDMVTDVETSCPSFTEIFAALTLLPEDSEYTVFYDEDEEWGAVNEEWAEGLATDFRRDFWYGSLCPAVHADGRRGLYIVRNGCSAQTPYCSLVAQSSPRNI
jgi:hypothetical protein